MTRAKAHSSTELKFFSVILPRKRSADTSTEAARRDGDGRQAFHARWCLQR
jgi:hypothetical protein